MHFEIHATLTTGTGNAALLWIEQTPGTAPSIQITDPPGNNVALSVAVAGAVVTVTLATDASSVPTSTAAQVLAAVQASTAASALVSVSHSPGSLGTALVAALATTTLAGHVRLPRNLHWSDEFDWSPTRQESKTVPGAGGVPITVTRDTPVATARPMTLIGGGRWSRVTRATLQALTAALNAPDYRGHLTTPSGDHYTVAPARDAAGLCVIARQMPEVGDKPIVDPSADTYYIIERISLMVLPGA